jgi:F-box/leucine-rich repeat protein 10/11
MLRPNEAPIANSANSYNDNAPKPPDDAIDSTALEASSRTELCLDSPVVTYEPSLRSAPLPKRSTPYSAALESPIEALADAAISSLHTSPTYVNSAHRLLHAPVSPASIPHPPGLPAPRHAYPLDSGYTFDERPAKRARSEFLSSPHYGPHDARPATSHIPGWSYNVEQMVNNGLRMYQDNPRPAQHQEESSLKRLSDAQLLMDFATTASTLTPHPAPETKRWSISHQEITTPSVDQQIEFNGPYAGVSHAARSPSPQVLPTLENSTGLVIPIEPSELAPDSSTTQTQTPPEDYSNIPMTTMADHANSVEGTKPKKNQGWPKGRSRGPRHGPSSGRRKKSTPRPKGTAYNVVFEAPGQLQSPQSLPAEQQDIYTKDADSNSAGNMSGLENAFRARRHSDSNVPPAISVESPAFVRSKSVPLDANMVIVSLAKKASQPSNDLVEPDTICAGCNSSESDTRIGDGEQWIRCDGCKEWYHFVCAGFRSEREVRDVDRFYCAPCKPKFGDTTKVRKSARAHTAVDYAGLNEGILKTSDDNPEHHYISAFKNGDIEFTPEAFARLPPGVISADFLEKTNGFKEPILIPATLNPRPKFPAAKDSCSDDLLVKTDDCTEDRYMYEMVPDDGQDKLDMVIPQGLTVRRVSELYGPQERVPVIDVKAQEGEDKRWTMAKWADYYEQQGEKPVRNVISLEVSKSRLGRLIRRPKAVRDMDLQDSVWREDDKKGPPAVQFYCLMSVADCYTDFHIDFGGSSVYYHIVKGKKVFFFIPPTKQNLKKYEEWCLSPKQGHEWLGDQVKECYRVDLYPGDTMLIPSGWIHAVWTPEDSLVIGGNFLTRLHYGMQIKVLEIEKATKVAAKFRYPFFQKIMWLTAIKYLEEDPLPSSVEERFLNGEQFFRNVPLYCETDRFGHNSHLGTQNYNRRYYGKAELEGLPDLANFVWRTVLISLGRIDGITETVRKAVTGSIPKGFGEPLLLARRFAMWTAWKRGNESIPQWAFPDATLPQTTDWTGEKKLSATQVKRMEREAWGEALRATAERHSTRIKTVDPPRVNGSDDQCTAESPPPPLMFTGFLQKTDPTRPLTTPKTSQLGPKRIACDACRKRRIRCKHKDELVETTKSGNGMNGGMNTIDLSGSLGLSVKRRYSDVDSSYGQPSNSADTSSVANGGPLLADVNADPYALKSGRVKACADCRKSKVSFIQLWL